MGTAGGSVDIDRLVRELPSLARLSGPLWESALRSATVVQAVDGGELSHDASQDHFTLVLQGVLRIRMRSDDGRIFGLNKVHPGEICPISVACMQAKRLLITDVLAVGDVIALRIPAARLDALMVDSSEFRSLMMASMTECYGRLLEVIQEGVFDHPDGSSEPL